MAFKYWSLPCCHFAFFTKYVCPGVRLPTCKCQCAPCKRYSCTHPAKPQVRELHGLLQRDLAAVAQVMDNKLHHIEELPRLRAYSPQPAGESAVVQPGTRNGQHPKVTVQRTCLVVSAAFVHALELLPVHLLVAVLVHLPDHVLNLRLQRSSKSITPLACWLHRSRPLCWGQRATFLILCPVATKYAASSSASILPSLFLSRKSKALFKSAVSFFLANRSCSDGTANGVRGATVRFFRGAIALGAHPGDLGSHVGSKQASSSGKGEVRKGSGCGRDGRSTQRSPAAGLISSLWVLACAEERGLM
jgi:hypothetical protein